MTAFRVTALLELARYFREHPPARTVIFLATSAHHLGLRGVDDFIQRYLRKEDPFIDHMLVRRVVEAALARNMIGKEGVQYALGEEVFGGKEALVRHAAGADTVLVARVAEAAIEEGIVASEGEELVLGDERFADAAELVAELRDDEDLRHRRADGCGRCAGAGDQPDLDNNLQGAESGEGGQRHRLRSASARCPLRR